MFCHLHGKKGSKVIAMSHPFPKNQSPKDVKLAKNIKMTNLLFFMIRIVSFKINTLFNTFRCHGLTG